MHEVEELFGTMKEMEAGIYSFIEHTLDTSQPALRKNFTMLAKKWIHMQSWKPPLVLKNNLGFHGSLGVQCWGLLVDGLVEL